MSSIKFIHTADLHLDTPFKGLSNSNKELAKRIKNATFKAFERIVDTCISEKVDFLLIAGDVFDRETKSLGAQLEFGKQLKKLSQNGIWTYIICGNHDPSSSWMPSLDLPEKVYRFGYDEVKKVIHYKNGEPAADIYGISYKDKALTENISARYIMDEVPARFSIAMLHGNLTGNTSHDNYAPFTLADLAAKNFDYWALGHIHLRQIINQKNPVVAYPGNPQGRDFGEKGEKGCFLVEMTEYGNPAINFIQTQLVRFEDVEVDLTRVSTNSELDEKIRDAIESVINSDDSAVIRLVFNGRTPMHRMLKVPSQLSSLLENFNEGELNKSEFRFIDSIIINTLPDLDLGKLKESNDFTSEILRGFDKIEIDEQEMEKLFEKLGGEITSSQFKKEFNGLSDQEKKEILQQAKVELLDKLISE